MSSDIRFALLSSLALSGACPKSYGVCVSLGTLLAPASSDLQVKVFVVFKSPDSSSCCLAPAGSSSGVSVSVIILFASRVPI